MSLSTYAGLVAALQSWSARADLSSTADDLIDLAEANASRNIRVRQMEAEATAAASEYIALPTDFLELRDIQWQGNPRRQLEYVTPQYADLYDTSGTTGTPKFYTLVGNQIRLIPAPSSTTGVRISYWQKVPALSSGNTTNWLLQDYPDYYLYYGLFAARGFIQDPQLASYIAQMYTAVMNEIDRAGKKSNVGGSLAVRPA